jgi:hypothetical protein
VLEVLKMLEAKVDSEVIKAYIKNSLVPYNLSASEIIHLKKQGVPDDILTALLQRGAEVRAQATSSSVMQGTAVPPDYQATPYASMNPYDYSGGGQYYPDYPYYSSYPYYPYSYWWYNNYWYPWGAYYSYWPYFFADHHHSHGHDHIDHHGHGDFHNGFHGHNSFNRPNQAASSPFGTFTGRTAGFSGNRAMSPFSPVAPHRTGFASSPTGFRPATGFSAPRPAGFSGGRPATSFASHVGGFRSGGGFAGRGGGGGHR